MYVKEGQDCGRNKGNEVMEKGDLNPKIKNN